MREPIRRVTLKDGQVRYRVVVDVGQRPDGKRDQRTSTHRTVKAAREWLSRTRADVTRGTYLRPDKETLSEHLDTWLESRRLDGKRPATPRGYEDALKPVRALMGDVPLQSLTADHVERVKAAMLDGSARRIGTPGKPMSARSVNYTLTTLRAALRQGVIRGKVLHNVAEAVSSVASDGDGAGAAWTVAEASSFKRTAAEDRLHAAWLLTCYGLRRGEVLGLQWDRDIDLDAATVTVRTSRTVVAGEVVEGVPKTRRGYRTLPLDAALIAALRTLRVTQATERLTAGSTYAPSPVHLVVDALGHPIRPEAYSDHFKRLAKVAGVPPIRLHDARHTSVTMMRSLGVPDHVVARWHGHDEAVMRRTYTHAYDEELRAAAVALTRAL